MIRTGLDCLLKNPGVLKGRRYGLLSNSAARSATLQPIHRALLEQGADCPVRLLGPEHGFYGVEQDMIPSADEIDPWTGVPIISLYGDSAESLVPRGELFQDLDLVVIDVQDVGSRYYTYAATAIWSAAVALGESCEVWILDRPNPLGGIEVEGNLPTQGFESFVGAFRLPVRHGLTLGEIAQLEQKRSAWPEGVRVWRVDGWHREMIWQDLGCPWVAPSPNLPTVAAAQVYPGVCLVEGTELSEGRGTTRPFQLVGAPGIDPVDLADTLQSRNQPGVSFVPTYFRPQFQKHAGEICGGVEIRVTDLQALQPYRLGVELLVAAKTVAPEIFRWREQPYEFVSDQPAIDLLAGSAALREALDAGAEPSDWIASWKADEEQFSGEINDILIYPKAGEE